VRSASYPGAAKLGRGKGYIYPHDDPRGQDLQFLPDELAGRVYYEPSGNGEELKNPGAES
jgi:putative ATPase